MNKEQIIDEVYKNYKSITHKNNEKNHYGEYSNWGDNPLISGVQHLTKDSFIQMIKIDPEFSEKWGLKIEERELSLIERTKILVSRSDHKKDFYDRNGRLIVEEHTLVLDESNIPTKQITLTYKDTIIESYE